jgi:hypothetical protein
VRVAATLFHHLMPHMKLLFHSRFYGARAFAIQ